MLLLVSYGCHNKLLQTGWLKTTVSYSLTVHNLARFASSGAIGENLLFASYKFWQLLEFSDLQPYHCNFFLPLGSLCFLCFYLSNLYCVSRSSLHLKILKLITSVKTLFSNKVHSQVWGIRMWIYHHSSHYINTQLTHQ